MLVAIIDDTPLNLTLMDKLVGRVGGCEARCFADPVVALDWCETHEPDLIVVDYMMPGIDGLEFIRRIRAVHDHDDLPILMVTANSERSTRYDALELGANDFLTKPIDPHEFQPRVRNMLKLREAHLATRDRAARLAEAVRIATAEIHARERETITRLARAAEFRDPETGAHIQRMAHYSALIAKRMGLDAHCVDEILQAAPMHDVGKLGIPDYILLKAGRLTPDELIIMKRHPAIGYDILKDSSSAVVQRGAIIALSHHEKFDGSGYPRKLQGTEIPLDGRIVAVADVFDALTSERPYKRAWTLDKAIAFLREGRGSHFDPDCADAFLRSWKEVLEIRKRFQDNW
ncbi:response regulator [Azoarcus sp. L1K30]|uniref:HD domain-containing phosphohydrolase n=1 Tax=Azoarcus sp. L1K30 TaxID=2820277 RepID=UPI001B83F0D2|nr:HD domain-containing phosphohydrolase [Azoarcus sp. L1K30]MBR0568419.1 response regulator [Azoarcus sp. L1K30]